MPDLKDYCGTSEVYAINNDYSWKDFERIMNDIAETCDREKRKPRETKFQTNKFYNFRRQKKSWYKKGRCK